MDTLQYVLPMIAKIATLTYFAFAVALKLLNPKRVIAWIENGSHIKAPKKLFFALIVFECVLIAFVLISFDGRNSAIQAIFSITIVEMFGHIFRVRAGDQCPCFGIDSKGNPRSFDNLWWVLLFANVLSLIAQNITYQGRARTPFNFLDIFAIVSALSYVIFRFAESKRKENGTWSDMEHMSDVKLNELGAILGFSSTEKFQKKRIFIMLGSASCEGCQKIAKKYLEKLSQHAALSVNPTSEEFFFNSIGTPFQPNTRVGVAKLVGGGHNLRSIFGIHVTPAIIEIDNKWSTKYVGFDGCMNWIDSEITHIQRN